VVDVDAEAALWRARRAVEAIICVLVCAHYQRVHKNDGEGRDLHGLIAELGKGDHIPEAVNKKFQNVRNAANVGTHVRRNGAQAAAELVGDVRKPLADLVRWLFTESAARDLLQQHGRALELSGELSGERAHQARVETELEAVRQAHRAELAQLHADHARELQALREENAALVTRERDYHAAIASAEGRVQAAERERKAAEALAKQRTIEVEAAKKKLAEALQRVENPGFFATLSRTVKFLAIAGFGAGALTALGAMGLLVFKDELKQVFNTVIDGRSQRPDGATDALLAPTPTPTPTTAPSPPPLAQCPAGTVQVAAASLRLEQPEGRKTWPAPPTGADKVSVSVPTFCVEVDRVQRAELPPDLRLSDQSQGCLDAHGGDWLRCLSGDEAAAVCAARLPGGRLPQIAELEALARDPAAMDRVRFSRSKLELEWLDDSFPPAVFKRPAEAGRAGHMTRKRFDGEPHDRPTALRWAYNQPPDRSKQAELVGFRCAAPLSPTP
jgi:hypothetical protein